MTTRIKRTVPGVDKTSGAGAAGGPPVKDHPFGSEVVMARKASKAREVDGSKGSLLVTVKVRLPADVLQGMREEALGRSGSLSGLVAEYFRGTPRRFWLQERSAKPAVEPAGRADGPEAPKGPKLSMTSADQVA